MPLFQVHAVAKGFETLGKYLLSEEGPATFLSQAFQRVRRDLKDKYETYQPLDELLDVLDKQVIIMIQPSKFSLRIQHTNMHRMRVVRCVCTVYVVRSKKSRTWAYLAFVIFPVQVRHIQGRGHAQA